MPVGRRWKISRFPFFVSATNVFFHCLANGGDVPRSDNAAGSGIVSSLPFALIVPPYSWMYSVLRPPIEPDSLSHVVPVTFTDRRIDCTDCPVRSESELSVVPAGHGVPCRSARIWAT